MMMQRLAFARLAARKKWNYINSSSPIPKKVISFSSISNSSNLQLLQSSSSSSSSWLRRCLFPRFSYLSNNPRSFSQISIVVNDAPPLEENGVVPMDYYDVGEEDADEFDNVVSLLLQSKSNADDDESLESSLDSLQQQHLTTLNQHFVVKLIETPNVSADHLIRFIKWARNKKSFKVTTPVLESLVSAICGGPKFYPTEKETDSLWDLVKDIGLNQSGVLNVHLLNKLIESFANLGLSPLDKGKPALEAFKNFEAFQCVPNKDTYYFTICALCSGGSNESDARSLCQEMLDLGYLPDDAGRVADLLYWFCYRTMPKEAYAVFLAAKQKWKQLPIYIFEHMVCFLCDNKETVQLALKILKNDIPDDQEGMEVPIRLYANVVGALCSFEFFDAAKQFILKMIADGPPPYDVLFKFVIEGYAKAGKLGQAMEMVKLMESRGFKPDSNTSALLVEQARKILEEAKKQHSKLSPVMLLPDMKDFGVFPNVDDYEKLVLSPCLKVMDWEMAKKLQEDGLYQQGPA